MKNKGKKIAAQTKRAYPMMTRKAGMSNAKYQRMMPMRPMTRQMKKR